MRATTSAPQIPGAMEPDVRERTEQQTVQAPANGAMYGGSGNESHTVEWEDIADQGGRHLIQTADVTMETEYFDDVVESLRELAPLAGGYVETSMLTDRGRQRMFTIVLRIPAARFESVLQHVQGLANVIALNQRADDVTDRFYDMRGNLETRRIEEDRILALIEIAEDIHELLALETRLSNTRLAIENYVAQLTNMAGQIAYSTINITLTDIADNTIPVPGPSMGDRIGGAFGDSVNGVVNAFQNFVVFMAGAIIPMLLLGLIAYTVYKAVRILRRRLIASRV